MCPSVAVVLIGGGGASWWPVVLIGGGGVSWWLVVPPGGGGGSWWLVVPPGGGGGSWWRFLVAVAASYCQPIPGRRTGGSRFRAAGLIFEKVCFGIFFTIVSL